MDRKLVESTFVSLDGVISAPQEWSPPYRDDEQAQYAHDLLFAADALLLGRKTYEGFAEAWAGREGELPSLALPPDRWAASGSSRAYGGA